jgi:hypothetical protein
MASKMPRNPRRSSRQPKGFASSTGQPMSRSHAQELRRAESEPSFKTKLARQSYWTARLSAQEQSAKEDLEDTYSQVGHVDPGSDTPFANGTFRTETLQDVDPNQGELESGNIETEEGFGPKSNSGVSSDTDAPAPS